MKLHEIDAPDRAKKRRLGRGISSGKGKTASRGTKGQKARAGHNIPRRFEGGQTPLMQRLPKAGGFASRTTRLTTVSVENINKYFKVGERVSPKTLFKKGLLTWIPERVKLIGPGKLAKFVRLDDVILTKKLTSTLPAIPRSKAKRISPAGKSIHPARKRRK